MAAAHEAAERCRLPDGGTVLLENIFPLDVRDSGDITPGGECPFLGQEAWVASDGRFNPRCAPDVLLKSLGGFGNVNDCNLRDVWESAEYRGLQATYMTQPLCQSCNMRRPQ